MQLPTEFPAETFFHIPGQGLQVLHHEHKLPAQPIRGVEDGGAGVIREHPFAPPAAQVGMRRPQFPREFGMACGAFPGEVE